MNKNLVFLCVISLLAFTQTFSQTDSEPPKVVDAVLKQFTPSIVTPNAATFQAVQLSGVNTYTGAASTSIPIFSIKTGKIEVPISLSYLSTGVKANEVASNVGLNWSLNAGGSVTKITKGYEDFSATFLRPFRMNTPLDELIDYTDFCDPDANSVRLSTVGWLLQNQNFSTNNYFDFTTSCVGKNYTAQEISDSFEIKKDSNPDLFMVNAPGLSTSFTHRADGSIMEIEQSGNQITTTIGKSPVIDLFQDFTNSRFFGFSAQYDGGADRRLWCVNKIETINLAGIRYSFEDLEVSQSAQRNILNPYPDTNKGTAQITSQQVNTYNLSKITDSEGNEVTFHYQKYRIAYPEYRKQASFENKTDETYFTSSLTSNEVKYPQLNRLTRIDYRNGSVEFQYNHNREDLPGDKALTAIIIKDVHSKVIKTFTLQYNYFISENACAEPTCKRLRLVGVAQSDGSDNYLPPYQFYYDPTPLPERGSYFVDYMGYANQKMPEEFKGKSVIKNLETTLIPPPIIYFAPFKKQFAFSPFRIFSDSYETKNGRSLAPSETYAQAGMLKRLITPTGAEQRFEYELNTFQTDGGTVATGTGLRLAKQEILDENKQMRSKEYFYIDTDGNPSGYLNNLPLFGIGQAFGNGYNITSGNGVETGIKNAEIVLNTFSSPNTQAELTHGASVGYSRILIREEENGYTEQLFTSPKDYPLEEPDFYPISGGAASLPPIQYAYDNGGFFQHFDNRDILLGKMTSEKHFDQDNTLILHNTYDYTYDEFEVIEQTVKVSKSQMLAGVRPQEDQQFEFKPKVFSHRNINTQVKKETTLHDQIVRETTDMLYDTNYPLVTTVTFKNSRNNEEQLTKNYYPFQTQFWSGASSEVQTRMQELTSQNRLSGVIQEEKYHKENDGTQILLTKTQTLYDWFDGLLLPKEVRIAKGINPFEPRLQIRGYDTYGNVTSISKSDGTPTSYIWGYHNSYPVAKLENIALTSIPAATINTISTLSDADTDHCLEAGCGEKALRDQLMQLQTSFSGGQVSTYTYDPIVGMTSMTKPTGESMYYDYDNFRRLQHVRDLDQNILDSYCYGYREGDNPCGLIAPDGLSVQVLSREYKIPIPNEPSVATYNWTGLPEDRPSLHPIFYFPRPIAFDNNPPTMRETPIPDYYNLPYPESFYITGFEATRTGIIYELEGLAEIQDIDPNYSLEWKMLIGGIEVLAPWETPELDNVLFPPSCIAGGIAKLQATISYQSCAEQKSFTITSNNFLLDGGRINDDNQVYEHYDTLNEVGTGGATACELLADILPSSGSGSGNSDPDNPSGGNPPGGGNNTTPRVMVSDLESFDIPVPNDLSAAKFSWTGIPSNRPSLHPVFYFPRLLNFDPSSVNPASLDLQGWMLPYPTSSYNYGWTVSRSGYRFNLQGIIPVTAPYQVDWYLNVNGEETPLRVLISESSSILFIPREYHNVSGKVVAKLSNSTTGEEATLESEIILFQTAFLDQDNPEPPPPGIAP